MTNTEAARTDADYMAALLAGPIPATEAEIEAATEAAWEIEMDDLAERARTEPRLPARARFAGY